MTTKQNGPVAGSGRDTAQSNRTPLLDDVSEASRLMKSPAMEDRRAGRQLLLRISADHGHAAVEAAQAQLGLLPDGHMAYWRQ
jgi:hypothetical protein